MSRDMTITVVTRLEYINHRLTGVVISYRDVLGLTHIETERGWTPSNEALRISDVVGETAMAIRHAHSDVVLGE